MTVTIRDHGYNALMRRTRLAAARALVVDVGVLGGDASAGHGEGTTVADVATWMEFGTKSIPARSFIRAYVDANEDRIRRNVRRVAERFIKGTIPSMNAGLELIGLQTSMEIMARIRAGIAPPNSPITIEWKGSATPLIDTGQLINSITYLVRTMAEAA